MKMRQLRLCGAILLVAETVTAASWQYQSKEFTLNGDAPSLAARVDSPIPYGGYHKEGKCGCYGAKTAIATAAEARSIISGFLSGHDLQIGNMTERPRFFRAELVDSKGKVRDVVIVDKLTGRIRSAK